MPRIHHEPMPFHWGSFWWRGEIGIVNEMRARSIWVSTANADKVEVPPQTSKLFTVDGLPAVTIAYLGRGCKLKFLCLNTRVRIGHLLRVTDSSLFM